MEDRKGLNASASLPPLCFGVAIINGPGSFTAWSPSAANICRSIPSGVGSFNIPAPTPLETLQLLRWRTRTSTTNRCPHYPPSTILRHHVLDLTLLRRPLCTAYARILRRCRLIRRVRSRAPCQRDLAPKSKIGRCSVTSHLTKFFHRKLTFFTTIIRRRCYRDFRRYTNLCPLRCRIYSGNSLR
jgi:hypothetical protein